MANPKKIYIFNPNDKPFGPLSNLFKFTDDFLVNNEKFNNILNYVYNFCGCTALDRKILARMKNGYEIHESAIKMNRNCYTEYTLNAIEKAYNQLFNNSNLRRKLLETGNKELFYTSINPIEGLGQNGNGLNRVGKILMKLRSQYQREEELKKSSEDSDKNKDYWKYITYKFLYELIIKGNNDLKEFENKTVEEIIDIVGKPTILESAISFDVFLELFKFNDPEEIIQIKLHPNKIAQILRKKYIEEYKNKLLYNHALELTEMYIKNKKMFQGQIVNEQDALKLIKFQPSKYNELIERILNLYLEDKLNPNLIREFNEKFKIPSADNIFEIKNFVLEEGRDMEVEEIILNDGIEEILKADEEENDWELVLENEVSGNIYFGPGGRPEYNFLNPQSVHLISIEGLHYPSVFHYKVAVSVSLARLYTDEKIDLPENVYLKYINLGHEVLLKNPNLNPLDLNSYELDFDTLEKMNNTIQEEMFYREIRLRLEKAYQIKFNEPELRQLLVNTGNSILIYSDPNDHILGAAYTPETLEQVKNEERTNLSGKILMEIRNKFIAEGMVITDIIDKGIRLDDLLGNNKEFMDWVYMRIDDMIDTVKLTINYLRNHENISQSFLLKPELIQFIINTIYANCKEILISYEKLSNTPMNVYKYISKRLKEYGIGPTGITLIWYYIYSLITQAIEHLGQGDADKAIEVLKNIPNIQKDSLKCEGFYENQVQNCTLVVIKKILDKMRVYIQKKYKTYKINENDINYVINLLVNLPKLPESNDREIYSIDISIKSEPYTSEQKLKIESLISRMNSLSNKNFQKEILQLAEDIQDEYLSILINNYEEEETEENLKEIKNYLSQMLDYRKEKDFIRTQKVKYISKLFEDYLQDPYLNIEEKNNILRKIIWFLDYLDNYTKTEENRKKIISRLNLFLGSNQSIIPDNIPRRIEPVVIPPRKMTSREILQELKQRPGSKLIPRKINLPSKKIN